MRTAIHGLLGLGLGAALSVLRADAETGSGPLCDYQRLELELISATVDGEPGDPELWGWFRTLQTETQERFDNHADLIADVGDGEPIEVDETTYYGITLQLIATQPQGER